MSSLSLQAPTDQTVCLFSAVQNTTGETRRFTMFPFGWKADADDIKYIPGNVISYIQNGHPQTSDANVQSFVTAVAAGSLTILHTEASILQDITTDESVMLVIDGGTLGTAQVCWDTSTETSTSTA